MISLTTAKIDVRDQPGGVSVSAAADAANREKEAATLEPDE